MGFEICKRLTRSHRHPEGYTVPANNTKIPKSVNHAHLPFTLVKKEQHTAPKTVL